MMEWQTKDTAPKDGTKILVFTIHGELEITEYYDLKNSNYIDAGNGLYRKEIITYHSGWNSGHFTHWMPLPSAPVAP